MPNTGAIVRMSRKRETHDANAILGECIRGETELARTLRSGLESESILPSHVPIVTRALSRK